VRRWHRLAKFISRAEYDRREEQFVARQYSIDKPKPNAMVGQNGWYEKTKQLFAEMMKAESYEVED
jgi:hypothetical protein